MMLGTAGLLALALQSQAPGKPDPAATREAITAAYRTGDLSSARTLASAYAIAWQDSFLVREVERFAGWPASRRSGKLWADSLRRAGAEAYSQDGAEAAITIWRRALARSIAIGDTALSAAISGNIGAGFLRSARLDSAESYLNRAMRLARLVGDYRVEANAMTALGGLSEDKGDLASARVHYSTALSLHERIGDTRGLAADRNNLGMLAWAAGDLAEAKRQFEAALAINRREGRDEVAATNMLNLAGLASLAGEFDMAEQLYRDALATWRAREEWAEAADAIQGLGQLKLRRGDYAGAHRTLTEALTILQRTGPLSSELEVRRMLAGALAAQGKMQGAVDALRQADDLANAEPTALDAQAGIVLSRADLAFQLNSLAEAERLYIRAERLYQQAGDGDGQAEAHHGRGLLLLAREDYAGAETMFESALRVQRAGGNSRAAGITLTSIGQLARTRGDTARARRLLTQAAADLESVRDPVSLAVTLGELAALEEDRGRPAAAEALYRRGLAGIENRVAPDVAWRLYAGLAGTRQARGASGDAAQAFRLAVAEVEKMSRSLVLPERRAGFLADKWEVYAELVFLERARGNPGAAFEMSERLRAREMLDLLGRGRIERPSGAAAELVAREQDLRRHIATLSNALEGKASGQLRGPVLVPESGAVREAMLAAQGAYTDLMLEMRERAPRHAELVSRPAAGWRDVAGQLAANEAFVEYLVSDSGTVAFVVVRDTLAIVDLGIGRHDLARLVAFARGTVETPRSPTDSLWRGPFRRLHRHLIEPLEESGLLNRASRLVLVPHAELHYLPFAALLSQQGPLIQRYEVATTPSATVWLALGERLNQPPGEGVLAVAPRTDALPGSEREVQAVARLAGPGVQTLLSSQATEAAFLRAAAGKRVLHLATYGVLNKHNPLFSFVEFAPDGSQDGRLEVHEVFGLSLNADLVVLSACQTGLGSGRLADVPEGDDWVSLTRAFLHAGAHTVVATLWTVDDRATAVLMEEFYKAYRTGQQPSRALAGAQRALVASRATAHPFFWAGIVVTEGESGRRAR